MCYTPPLEILKKKNKRVGFTFSKNGKWVSKFRRRLGRATMLLLLLLLPFFVSLSMLERMKTEPPLFFGVF